MKEPQWKIEGKQEKSSKTPKSLKKWLKKFKEFRKRLIEGYYENTNNR